MVFSFFGRISLQADMSKKIRDNLKMMEEAAQKADLMEEEKPDKSLSGLCPFTFETLWNVIENNQEGDKNMNLDSLVMEKLDFIERELILYN